MMSSPLHKDDSDDYAQVQHVASYAISQSGNTSLGLSIRSAVNANPGKSGLHLLKTGSDSFAMRLALIQSAEKTIDLQYYSIHDDTTSNLLLEALVQAVRRRVRIRFLLDDINFAEVSKTFCVLNGFSNLDIRVFNPFDTVKENFFMKWIKIFCNLNRSNRRMHNKALIVDNQMAIIGGRNLGDEYFEEHTDITFRDIDILTAGPVTAQISASFDEYWNSKNVIALSKIRNPDADMDKTQEIRRTLHEHWEKVYKTAKGKKLLSNSLAEQLKNGDVILNWAEATLFADKPEKIEQEHAQSVPLAELHRLLENAKQEFIAVSPYFVPRKDGAAWLSSLVKRGLKIKILTNSLGSTDVVAVHTGYRRYRKQMLKAGIELFELKPIDGKRPRQRLIGKKVPARASLHAKIYVIDRKITLIGSFNLDPRSSALNTELAVVIRSEELGKEVATMFEKVTAPDTSYKLQALSEEGDVIWKTKEKGKDVEFKSEPHPGIIRTIEASIIATLPIEDQL